MPTFMVKLTHLRDGDEDSGLMRLVEADNANMAIHKCTCKWARGWDEKPEPYNPNRLYLYAYPEIIGCSLGWFSTIDIYVKDDDDRLVEVKSDVEEPECPCIMVDDVEYSWLRNEKQSDFFEGTEKHIYGRPALASYTISEEREQAESILQEKGVFGLYVDLNEHL